MTPHASKTRQRPSRGPGEFTGLKFAVYSRKSTDDARHEDHRSTARQIAQAQAYVEARGGDILAGSPSVPVYATCVTGASDCGR